MADDSNPTNDPQLFERLDRYLAALHAGDDGLCSLWLAEHPELRDMAKCLHALDLLSDLPPNRSTNSSESTQTFASHLHEAATIAPSDAASHTSVRTSRDGQPAGEFGKYELLEEIGRGGMGVVFKARQRDLNRVVALKMILSNRLAADDDVKRFYREARAAGSLRHPQIVGIHEVGQINGQHYFAMDFIAGTSLAGITKSGPLDCEQAARCLQGVARAVQFLHDHGIVHRDLKPSNILLDRAGTAYVTDFGLAKVFTDEDQHTQTGVILGTPGYMPPEQAAGRISDISPRSDVYSLGAILYEMLTGRPPFREDNQLNTILQVLEGEPTLPNQLNAKVPPELERICLKCLEKAPERRYSSAAAFADDLERFLRCEEIEATPAGIVDRIRRWTRRESGLAARLTIMAAVAAIFQTAHLLRNREWDYHIQIKIAFALWAFLAFVFQGLLRREKSAGFARLSWAVTDPLFLTFVLFHAEEIGPILVGYPVLISTSGLWFSVRLVVISTAGCILSYAALLAIKPCPVPTDEPHYPLIVVTALIIIGWVVGFQVRRVRTLSRYFEQSRPPDAP